MSKRARCWLVGLGALLLPLGPALATAQDKGSTALSPVHTDFDPKRDALDFPNVGSFVSPEGDCVGFSAVAIANMKSRVASGAAPLTGLNAEAQAIAVQGAYQQKLHDGAYFLGEDDPLSLVWKAPKDPSIGQSLRDQLASAGPQILEIQSPAFGPNVAHAVVVYGYEHGHFLVSDSNAPHEVHELPFDPKKGFGSLEPYGALTKLKLIDDGADLVALAGKLQPSCAALDGTCAANMNQVVAERLPSDTAIVFSGSVSGGLATRDIIGHPTDPPAYVAATVGDRRLGEVHVAADGRFEMTLPKNTTGVVRFWAYTDGSSGAGVPQIAGYSTATYDLAAPATSASSSTGVNPSPTSPSIGLAGAVSGAAR